MREPSMVQRRLPPLDPLLTVEQVAKYLNVNKFTVYRLLAQKRLPAFKVGNQWRFKKEMIEAGLMKSLKKSRK
jgi:excisionase family DNA binding protein